MRATLAVATVSQTIFVVVNLVLAFGFFGNLAVIPCPTGITLALIMGGLIVLSKVFTDTMTITIGSTSIQATMPAVETSLANAGSIDTLTMFLASLIAGLQITSGSLPFW